MNLVKPSFFLPDRFRAFFNILFTGSVFFDADDMIFHGRLVINAANKGMTLNAYIKTLLEKATLETHPQ
jgi:hypothetical protein